MKRFVSRPVVIGVILVGVLTVLVFPRGVVTTYEKVMLAAFPSAQRASAYGMRHFNASHSFLYSYRAAEYFYEKALELDPQYPYVHHQLARLHFLKGNYGSAMIHINKEIELHGDKEPNRYYIRGLIEGFMGEYEAAIRDYKHFIDHSKPSWAGINDYAWVLLKAERYEEAKKALEDGILIFPNNAWLLNSLAIAKFELGDVEGAWVDIQKAKAPVYALTEKEWLKAYPGNDPRVALTGLETFRKSVDENIHRIGLARASSTVQ